MENIMLSVAKPDTEVSSSRRVLTALLDLTTESGFITDCYMLER